MKNPVVFLEPIKLSLEEREIFVTRTLGAVNKRLDADQVILHMALASSK